MTDSSSLGAPGFYGKSPALGDFVSRRIPAAFLPVWDAFLTHIVSASRAALGAEWLDAWNEAPVWHFTLGHGIAGPQPWRGVLIPSVDRVGRQFPFSILGPCGDGGADEAAWALRAEALALGALEDAFAPHQLDADLAVLGPPAPPAAPPDAGQTLWRCRDAPRVPQTRLQVPGLPSVAEAVRLVSDPG